jgi:hypothetical protein
MTFHFTVPKPLLVLLAVLGMFMVSASWCDTGSSTNTVETNAQSNQQGIYNQGQPIPNYPYSNYRQSLIQLENQLATGNVTTWTTWETYSGTPVGVCKSMGWPIPVTTQLSNPLQPSRDGGYTGGAAVSVGQMDPIGVYPPPSGLGTWVMCLDPAGVAHPIYAEGVVTAYPWEVQLQNGKFVQTGQPDQTTAIKPCKYDAATKKCLS